MATRNESPDRIEPCRLEELPAGVADRVAAIAAESARLGARLPAITARRLADLVAAMNCYYSNLIEGHDTLPRDIERALADDLDADHVRRNLQIEARAHIRLQVVIDRRHADGALGEPARPEFIRWLHREFYRDAPPEMLRIEGAGRVIEMEPGSWRRPGDGAFAVGRHLPPAAEFVDSFMDRLAERYRFAELGRAQRIVSVATAHHRLNYIHPFPDGNGRVSRLMSHAMALEAGIGAHGLWSIARGLARGLRDAGEYKRMMDHADTPRRGDLDGRGNLSTSALIEFVEWFLDVVIDQIRFMTELFDLDGLTKRLRGFVARSATLRPETAAILEELVLRGEMPRGAATRVTGLAERAARDALGALIAAGLVGSEGPKGPVSLRFPAHAADALFPRLYPAQAG